MNDQAQEISWITYQDSPQSVHPIPRLVPLAMRFRLTTSLSCLLTCEDHLFPVGMS